MRLKCFAPHLIEKVFIFFLLFCMMLPVDFSDALYRDEEVLFTEFTESLSLSFFFFFFLFRVTPVTYGIPRLGVNQSCTCWPMPQPQKCRMGAVSVNYTTANGNAGSLTYWARPGIKLKSSWILVGFLTAEPQQELP